MATKFCTVVTNVGAPSFFRDSFLAPRILRWMLNFWKKLVPLVTTFGLPKPLLVSRSASLGHRMRHRALAVGRVGYVVERYGGLCFQLRTMLSAGCGRGYIFTHS